MDAYVIGAGPAGLATAAALRRRGVPAVVLERESVVGASWRRHYDRLHLHTPRELSGLPGLPIPAEFGRWVARDDVVRYLELYAAHHRLEVRTSTPVARIERGDRPGADPVADGRPARWLVDLDGGESLPADLVVVATGFNHTPVPPDFPGIGTFTGRVVRACDFRSGEAHAGQDVLVVGTGNTGTEIAVDLAEHGARRVRLAVRTPPHIVRRDIGPWAAQYTGILVRRLPVPLVDWAARAMARLSVPDLTAHGLGRPPEGMLTRVVRDNAIPVQDVGLIAAVQAGQVEPVAALQGFAGRDVLLADGTRIQPGVVVVATGWRQGLEPIVGHLGVLDARGLPLSRGGRTPPGADGLWFTGYTNPVSGMLREIAIDARRIARAAAGQRARQQQRAG